MTEPEPAQPPGAVWGLRWTCTAEVTPGDPTQTEPAEGEPVPDDSDGGEQG